MPSREEIVAKYVCFSTRPSDINYVSPDQYALLLDMADFFTPSNIQRYLVDYCDKMIPCSKRTIYRYLTRIVPDPAYTHIAHYTHNGELIHVRDWYERCLEVERRRNNDIFGRGNNIQVMIQPGKWVTTTVCQCLSSNLLFKMHLFDHIHEFLPEIRRIIKEESQEDQEDHPSPQKQLVPVCLTKKRSLHSIRSPTKSTKSTKSTKQKKKKLVIHKTDFHLG